MAQESIDDALIDSLVRFTADRLPALLGDAELHGATPCLAEDWWVADQLPRLHTSPMTGLSSEQFLRKVWRWGRDFKIAAIGTPLSSRGDDAADLLLHQITVLQPAMFAKALDIFREQRG